jgi:hypothetical protein
MIPLPLITALVAGIVAGAGAWQIQEMRYERQIADINAAYASQLAAANADALAQTVALQKAKDEALKQAAARQAGLARSAAASRDALGRVQNTAAEAMRVIQYSHGSAIATATAYKTIYGECSSRLVEVGQAADGHASDVQTLIDSWPVR